MGKIIISRDGVVEQDIPLRQERMAIGRRSRNDIVLDHPAVSGEHAVIITIRGESFLEDLRSTNGTFVNGQRIVKHFLQHQDQIKLAKYRIQYVADGVRPVPVVPMAAVSAMPAPALASPPDTQQGPQTVLAGVAAPKPAPAISGHIEVLNGANAGKQLALTKPLTTLGRPGVQVIAIARTVTAYSIAHVDGDTSPLLNGTALGRQPQRLNNGDVIELGGTRMAFRQV